MLFKSFWEGLMGRDIKGSEIFPNNEEFVHIQLFCMGDSVQSSEDQSTETNIAYNGQGGKISARKDC